MNRYSCFVAAALILAAMPSFAQTSVGYADPDDFDALFAYRLPDWGWRSWEGSFQFNGQGTDAYDRTETSHYSQVASRLDWFAENEQRVWDLAVTSEMYLNIRNDPDSDTARDRDRFRSRITIDATRRQYLGDTSFFALAGADAGWEYSQVIEDGAGLDHDSKYYSRSLVVGAQTGFGVGRIRNVTPLIMAQRISERLVALGRPALAEDQVVVVAQAITRRSGYEANYERSRKHFWQAVLAPVLEDGRPLTPYEVHYLEDVERESLQFRQQGTRLQFEFGWQESRFSRDVSQPSLFDSAVDKPHEWTTGVSLRWVRNLSLDTMVSFHGNASYAWERDGGMDRDTAESYVQLGALRDVSDRQRWSAQLMVRGEYEEWHSGGIISRGLISTLRISDRIWVEDQFMVMPYAEATYATSSGNGYRGHEPRTDWRYGVDFTYYFDSMLY